MLLLFDIDGTLLLKASRAHAEALYEAVAAVHRIELPRREVETAGRTDPAIARSLLTLAGVDARQADDRMPDVRSACCEAFARRCPPDLSATVSPGMPEALAELAGAGHVLSLVTGNYEPVARLKLRRAGLGAFFASGQGGFGSDDEDRAALPFVARSRAGRREHADGHHPRADTLVIGDTPRDIACAQADDVRCIAITTGPFSRDELAGADAIVDHASELPGAVTALAATQAPA